MENNFPILEATISMVQKAFHKNQLCSTDLVFMYFDRIAKYDHSGPMINSILELNSDAIQIAESLDHVRMIKGKRGMLHGIPILIKDNIETGDRMHTSAGSLALKDSYGKEDAFVIKKLRKAGAILLGKTNMTEWANFMSEGMKEGYSSRGGQVKNPYGLKHLNPGGSSTGSAAAVSCNFCMGALGTETSGSIINPSCVHGIVGIKPTIGLISRSGVIPASSLQDTVGPMTRTVEDAAIMLGAMVGYDENDPITIYSTEKGFTDYTKFLDLNGLNGVRIGIAREYFFDSLSEEEQLIMDNQFKIMKQHGTILVDQIQLPYVTELRGKTNLLYEFKEQINAYLSKLDPHIPVHNLSELIQYHKTYAESMLKYGQSYMLDIENASLMETRYVNERKIDYQKSREALDQTIKEHNLDAFVFPSDTAVKFINKAGYPMITVPAGILSTGKPFGITFAGTRFSEPQLIKIAYAFEQLTKMRVKPNFE